MKCPSCGSENLAGAEICDYCSSSMVLSDDLNGTLKDLLDEPVQNLKPSKPICIKPSDSLYKAINLMRDQHLGCVLVTQGKQLKGIFTERDALHKIAGQNMDLNKQFVSEYMTPRPEVMDSTHSMAYALNKMSVGGYRHLPVLTSGKLTGIISIRDILKYFWEK